MSAADRLNAARVWSDEPEVVRFLAAAEGAAPLVVVSVIELGSFRMHNHDPTQTWPHAEWRGIDWREGPGVTNVGVIHEIALTMAQAEVVLSISMLEHDPHWDLTLAAAVFLVRQGGLLAITCTGPNFPSHEEECAPGGRYYRNLTKEEVQRVVEISAMARGIVPKITSWYERRTVGAECELRICLLAKL